ncbi:MAG: Uma2 family endonuclease [Thermomicrobiales bacterium]|nr:Uma2 family endonuclease [Thermomicrobiales bacterium]
MEAAEGFVSAAPAEERSFMVATYLTTARDLWELGEKIEPSELIEGELKRMVPPAAEHGKVQIRLGGILDAYAEESGIGQAFGEIGYVLSRDPDTVLAPDLSLVAAHRLPGDLSRFLDLAPDLAVEIVSPGNSPGEIERKLAIYLQSGVRSVWILYPPERQIVIHSTGHPPRVLFDHDELDDPEVLPGFSVPVARVFGGGGR